MFVRSTLDLQPVIVDKADLLRWVSRGRGCKHRQSAKKGGSTTCTFTFSFTNTSPSTEDGVPPGGTFIGTVIARITPAS